MFQLIDRCQQRLSFLQRLRLERGVAMTTASTETPPTSRKRKRVNKTRKKAWARHSDITDVEEFLEDKRLQERTG